MVKFNLFNQLDIWIFKINDDYREIIENFLVNGSLLKKMDFRRAHSDFCILHKPDTGSSFLVKKIKYQIMADQFRRYIGLSQAMREFRSARSLERLKISCPSPVLAGTNISPMGTYESLFICRYLSDHVDGKEFLRGCPDPAARKSFLSVVAADLAVIHGNDLFHKDTNFGNILCHPRETGHVYWIDNDLKKMGSKFDAYEKLALYRLRNEVLQKNYINQKEWDFFLDCYRNSLTKQ